MHKALIIIAFIGVCLSAARSPAKALQTADVSKLDEEAVKILSRCQSCHSGSNPGGGLNLISREMLLKGGVSGNALILGHSERSRVFLRVAAKQMPPDSPLNETEVGIIKKWIDRGAKWDTATPLRADKNWWSLQPISVHTPPPAKFKKWVRNPIDLFIGNSLAKNGMHPAPPADKRTLLRRVYFDLIGLPPTPQDIENFLRDRSVNSYEKVVDRLLQDPRYGERWARHWLDVARFGESHGFERDQLRPNAWRYRDYVIKSLNADKPYAQFINEQIAGDVLTPHSEDGIIATGFLVGAPWDEVGYTQVSSVMKARVHEEAMEELVGTVSQTFLGLTVNCARCHDHKFDPIKQSDFYRLRSALSGVRHGERSILTTEEEKMRSISIAKFRKRLDEVNNQITSLEAEGRKLAFTPNETHLQKKTNLPVPYACWTFENAAEDSQHHLNAKLFGGATISAGRLLLGKGDGYLQTDPLPVTLKAKSFEAWLVLPDRTQKGGGVLSVQNGDQFDSIVYAERESGKWIAGSNNFERTQDLIGPPEVSSPQSLIHIASVYRADGTISVYRNGKPYGTYKTHSPVTFEAQKSFVLIGLRHIGAVKGFLKAEIEEARLYDRDLSAAEIEESYKAGVVNISHERLLAALSKDKQKELVLLEAQKSQTEKKIEELNKSDLTYAANSVNPETTHILLRGDPESPADIVAPAGLSCLTQPPSNWNLSADAPEGTRRLCLAKWISSTDNPLPWRVIVNRIWLHHFGKGIVETPSDFGFNGEKPSHPELLDWLAQSFLNNGGRLKPLHRLILLSNTYRQSSAYISDYGAKDADDRLLWRFAPRRLEGEAVRDELLSVSGALIDKKGGPSFRPFKEFVDNAHFYKLVDSDTPDFNRRSIYRMSVQSAKNPLLESLDCPDPSTKTPHRSITTTPLQALELMNSSFVMRQSSLLAERLRHDSNSKPAQELKLLYNLAYGREVSKKELIEGTKFLKNNTLETFCWAVLNSSEFLYVR